MDQQLASATSVSSPRPRGCARAESLYPDDMSVIIHSACLHARSGEKSKAMDLLERVFDKGWGK
jgi:hypothetical protein